ncbi:hypothetical protein ILYODFUR_029641 [Ilyodon furcidens]|uniref:Uncharacterized protein n=1 Tax=Ilyodon furcidens TaxID=33524 RepID=A0ABV0V757_9TELE
MDLVSWFLNEIDQIFSREDRVKGNPPDGTFFSGLLAEVEDCVSVEDVQDVCTMGCLITGFLLFGVGGYVAYREIRKTSAAVLAIVRLPGTYDGIFRAISTQTEMLRELNCRLDVILTQDRRQVAVPGLRGEMG